MILECFHVQAELCKSKVTTHLARYLTFDSLAVIITDIMDQIYPVKSTQDAPPRQQSLQRLEERLHKWQINLPDHLRYSAGHAQTPLPHILILHIEYYSAVLLLHRAL